VLATVVTPLDAVDKQLAKVGALAWTEADRQAAARLRQLVGALRQQGRQLFPHSRVPAWERTAAKLRLRGPTPPRH
jgi:hypothetical protein